ncbi:MAG: hypothetical protein WB784_00620 [Rhodanobacteraceae bacterium]
MIRLFKRLLMPSFALIGAFAGSVSAQSGGGPYGIDRSVVAGGGGSLAGGTFELRGTVGQVAGTTLSGSGYRFYGGFWEPTENEVPTDRIFANGFDN